MNFERENQGGRWRMGNSYLHGKRWTWGNVISIVFWWLALGDTWNRKIGRLLWEERQPVSVANLARQVGIDFLRLAPQIGIVTQTTSYLLNQANQALDDLRGGRFEGAAVLVPC